MSGRAFRRILALSLLGLWLAPGAGALAVGLHVALDHGGGLDHRIQDHGDPGHTSAKLDELVAAVAHGHRHSVEVPRHDHPAQLDASLAVSPAPSTALIVPPAPAAATDEGHGEPGASRHRRAPPAPLFRVNCSLLL